MSLAVPSALAFALVALPIIVFYILKVRLRQVPVSTNMFWKQIFDEKPPRSIWQRFKHLLSLLAQLLLLGLMVFAVADPVFSWQAMKARRVVLVIDSSASMQATDIKPSRFEAATDRAIELVDGLRFRDEMAIVLAGARSDVLLGMSGHVPTLKEAIRSIEVSDNPTRLDSAIELGRQLIGDHANGEIVVLTDGCASNTSNPVANAPSENKATPVTDAEQPPATTDSGEDISSDIKVTWQVFATEAPNIGITKFQVRRSLVDMLGYEVLASVKNASDKNIKCRLEISLADSVVDVLPLELKPGELWSRSLEKTSREGGVLAATLTEIRDADDKEDESKKESSSEVTSTELNALAADDNAWAVLPEQKVQNVLIITEGNLFLRKVFEANPLVNVVTRSDYPDKWPEDTLMVFHRLVPKVLPPGDIFVVDPIEDCDQWTIGETIENPIVTEIDTQAELMTHVRLDNVVLPEARKISFKETPKILAGTISKDVVYAQLKRSGGKCLLLSVDLDKSDLAFRTTFPIMVTNALNWFVESSGGLRESTSTGEFVSWPVNTKQLAGKSLILQDPDQEESTVATFKVPDAPGADEQADSLTLGPFESSGVWALGEQPVPTTIKAKDNPPIEFIANFAVNIADERETDLRPGEEMMERSEEAASLSGWFGKPVWYYLVLTAMVLFIVEWSLHQRRVLS